ncbi:prefoldin subunit 4 [Rhizoctonia solani 123E]|uniref:Prefoldin subunit 4 n=2 Tax=Rhizoctonia solani AG-3 TaxID=1086053 RepID=A0A074S856_9AGAM|nr:prefoldin subunit 4 [Rhizoctonia solani 123E]
MRMLNQDEESEENTEVTWEDQQRINAFSKLNTRCTDLEEKVAKQKSEKEALDDLAMELELADEDEPVEYKIGEAFFHISLKRAQMLLQKDQESIDSEINGLQGEIDQCQQEMKDLKVALYAKFGKQINLD